jgi:hypothetical protein
MSIRVNRISPRLLVAALSLGALPASSWAQRVLDFAQLDGSSSSTTLVLVRALGDTRAAAPAPLLSFSATRWGDGSAAALGAVARWHLGAVSDHALTAGAGAGLNHFESRVPGDKRSDSGASLRGQLEGQGPAPGGRYYALLQASSFRSGWFVSGQYSLGDSPLALELSRYGERGYHASTLALRWAVGGGWSLRGGAVRDDEGSRGFVGVSYNGF